MKRFLPVMIYFTALVCLLPDAQAEVLSGSVYSIDPIQNTVTVEHQDELTGNPRKSVLAVVPATVFPEYQTLDTLKSGDSIWIETERGADGNLLAKSVEVVNA